jgi:hypothetical protein
MLSLASPKADRVASFEEAGNAMTDPGPKLVFAPEDGRYWLLG